MQSLTNQSQDQDRLPDHWVKALWDRFLTLYPKLWANKFADVEHEQLIKREWSLVLSGLSGEQIKVGLEQYRLYRKTPPETAMEFKEVCLGNSVKFDNAVNLANKASLVVKQPEELAKYWKERDRLTNGRNEAIPEALEANLSQTQGAISESMPKSSPAREKKSIYAWREDRAYCERLLGFNDVDA